MEGDSLFPKDVWKLIGSNLDSYSLWCLKRTCKRFHGDVFKEHVKVKSTDVETALLQYVSDVTDVKMLNINAFSHIASDLFRNYAYNMSVDVTDRLFCWVVKTLDSPSVLFILRDYTCFKFPMNYVLRDVIYNGNIWTQFTGHFLFSYETIKECLIRWSKSTAQAHGKHFAWLSEHGISPPFIKQAFDDNDTEVIKAIFYDLHIFLDDFEFCTNYYIQMQNVIDDAILDTKFKDPCKAAIRFLTKTSGFVIDHLCALLKKHKIHDEVVGNICGCCNYQVTKKLKVIK